MMVWLMLAAQAEDSAFIPTAVPDPKAPESVLTAELGASLASGNSNFYTVNGLMNASHKAVKNQISGLLGINIGGAKVVGETSGPYVENVRRFSAEARYDRFLTKKDTVYVLAGAFHDPYAGYDLRAHEQIGYSRLLLTHPTAEVRAELGADVAQEDFVDGTVPAYQDVVAARVLFGVTKKFGVPGPEPGAFEERLVLSDVVEVYESVIDFEDLRVLNTAALTTTLSGKLSLKLSHSLIFDNVPVEGFAPLDQTTMVTLVASLL